MLLRGVQKQQMGENVLYFLVDVLTARLSSCFSTLYPFQEMERNELSPSVCLQAVSVGKHVKNYHYIIANLVSGFHIVLKQV